jgi:pyrimidine operon attenuation protein/uracil phosphoribosyltransferase
MQTNILDATQIQKKITRIAYEIHEEHAKEKEIILAGVVPGGYALAQKIGQALKKISPIKIDLLKINIAKVANSEALSVSIDTKANLKGKTIIMVDDVLNTGKVLSYSMTALLENPVKCLRIAVLIDRNHTLFPIKSDYTGLSIATTMQDHILVDLESKGNESAILKD